jgi:hypothetical protein
MRRSSTSVSRLVQGGALLAGTLIGCLSSETIDLGSNYPDAHAPEADGPSTVVPDSGAEAAPQDAPVPADSLPFDAAAESEADAPIPVGAPICIPNPSFEIFSGDAGSSPLLTAPQDWQACGGGAVNAQACMLPPAQGNTYLALSIGLAPFVFNPASVDSALCDPLEAGVTYSLSVELALDAPDTDASPSGEPPALQLRGSDTACDPQADLLVRFSGATNTCGWKSLCATFVPQRAYSHLVLIPEATSSTGLVYSQTNMLVDDLRSGDVCPPR